MYLLSAVLAGLIRGMEDYLFHKLIYDVGISSLIPTYLRIMAAKLLKSVCLAVGINGGLLCSNKLCQFLLLRFILGGQLQKSLMADCAYYIVLIV